MDEKLVDIEEKFINEVIENGGSLDIDFTNDLHYNYYCEQLKKIGISLEKTPNFVRLLETQRRTVKKSISEEITSDNVLIGPNDSIYIDIPDISVNKELRDSTDGAQDTIVSVSSVAKYCNIKSNIIINSTVRDELRKRSLTDTKIFEDSNKAKNVIAMNTDRMFDGNPRKYSFISNFTSVEEHKNKPVIKATYNVNESLVIDENVIESFTVIDPKPNKTKGNKVMVSYNRDTVLKDFDYSIDNTPIPASGDNPKYIKIMLDVSFRLRLKPGYKINGIKKKSSPILTLDHPYKGVVKCYYYSQTDSPLVKIEDERTAVITLPKETGEHKAADWCSIIPFTDLEDTTSANLNIYGQFTLSVTKLNVNNPSANITFPFPVSFRSEKGDFEFTAQNIETEPIYMKWGCIGKDTLITLANEEKTALKISELKIGDCILTDKGDKGDKGEILDIITGRENKILSITTDSKKNILLTKAHSIKANEQWITVGELEVGMKVQCENGTEAVVEIVEETYEDLVYNLKFKEETGIIGNGFIIGDYDMQQCIKPQQKKEEEVCWSEETKILASELKSLNIGSNN